MACLATARGCAADYLHGGSFELPGADLQRGPVVVDAAVAEVAERQARKAGERRQAAAELAALEAQALQGGQPRDDAGHFWSRHAAFQHQVGEVRQQPCVWQQPLDDPAMLRMTKS